MQHVQYSYIVVHILCCSFENRILWSYRPKLTPQETSFPMACVCTSANRASHPSNRTTRAVEDDCPRHVSQNAGDPIGMLHGQAEKDSRRNKI